MNLNLRNNQALYVSVLALATILIFVLILIFWT
jgi:hypothetical protein